jgi:broad specificity phosphatase PhoE
MTGRDDFGAIERGSAGQASPRLFVFARHAESTANTSGLVSSDPERPVTLTHRGRQQARGLGAQVAGLDIELAVATRFRRTQETAALAVGTRPVPVLIESGLDEIQARDLDGSPLEDYWAWKNSHTSADRFPNGESVDEARTRHAAALRRLLSRTERVMLIVVHELALRWIAETATGSPLPPDSFGNAMVYLFGEHAVERAAVRLEKIAAPPCQIDG